MKINKTNFTCIVWLLAGLNCLYAQSSVNAAGGNATSPGGSVNYSIGQIDYITVNGYNGMAAQGVQQPFEIYVMGIDHVKDISLEISAYPNPAVSDLYLRIGNQELKNMSYQLIDQKEALLYSREVTFNLTKVSMKDLPSAIYFLKVFDNNREIKSFKIIKK